MFHSEVIRFFSEVKPGERLKFFANPKIALLPFNFVAARAVFSRREAPNK